MVRYHEVVTSVNSVSFSWDVLLILRGCIGKMGENLLVQARCQCLRLWYPPVTLLLHQACDLYKACPEKWKQVWVVLPIFYWLFRWGSLQFQHFIQCFALDAIDLSRVGVWQNYSFQYALLYPTSHSCVINAQNAGNLRDSQQFAHTSCLPFLRMLLWQQATNLIVYHQRCNIS